MIEDDSQYHQHREPRAITPEYLAEMKREYEAVKWSAESFGATINARYVRDLLADREKLVQAAEGTVLTRQECRALVNALNAYDPKEDLIGQLTKLGVFRDLPDGGVALAQKLEAAATASSSG